MTAEVHEHRWVECSVGCEDCGDHLAVRCADPDCDRNDPIDLVREDDPREACPVCEGAGWVDDPTACGDPEHCSPYRPCPRGCPIPQEDL